jgi:gluconate 5-dehydrogenase
MDSDVLHEMFSLHGQVALVTGASGGIGSALARGLARAGAAVALHGRAIDRLTHLASEIQEARGIAAPFAADLNTLDAIDPMVSAVQDRLGPITILVNCAGTNRRLPIAEITPETYDSIMATNLRSLFFLTRTVASGMADRGGGKIVNIGSLTAHIGLADVSVYGVTKSGLAQLTKTMAIEWAGHNIQVNCLCPGFIATELTAPLWSNPERRRWMLDRLPIKRAGRPEDLVGLTIYLASRASDYTTGQTFTVDGGFLAGSQW